MGFGREGLALNPMKSHKASKISTLRGAEVILSAKETEKFRKNRKDDGL